MKKDSIKSALESGKIEGQRHALEKMMERGISRVMVKEILLTGEIIEDYFDDKPYPSALFLGWIEKEPFHVVVHLIQKVSIVLLSQHTSRT